MFRKYWFAIVGLLLMAIALVVALILPNNVIGVGKTIEAITVILGWVLFLGQYFYSKSESFYIRVNNLRMWFTNGTTKWNFTIDFYDCEQANPIDIIWRVISNQNKLATKWHKDSSLLIINMPGYTIRAFTSEGKQLEDVHLDTQNVTCVQVSNLELPYRTFKTKIENEIIPLAKDIADMLHPKDEKYAAKISFTSSNPYLGFFVRKLELPKVVSFTCDLIETSIGGHEQTVIVRKDRIEIVTNNLLALQLLSMKYMALSGS